MKVLIFFPSEPAFPNSCVLTNLQMPVQLLTEAAPSEAHSSTFWKQFFLLWAELMKPDFPRVCTQVPPRFTHAFQDCFPQDFCSLMCHLYSSSQHYQNYKALTFCHVLLSSRLLQTQRTREQKTETPSAQRSSTYMCWLTEWEAKDRTNLLSSCSSPYLSKGDKPIASFSVFSVLKTIHKNVILKPT